MNEQAAQSDGGSPSVLLLVGLTAGLVLVLYIVSEIGNYYEITRNWAHYQCQPSIAPFAKFYGHDPIETMNFCIGQAVKEHAGGVITPIYRGVEEVASVVSGAYDKVTAIEHGIGGLLQGFDTFVTNFQNSFRMVGVRVRMSLVSIMEIFQRVYAIFVAFTYAGIAALTFGENLVCNPLTTFIGTIAGVDICCFAPETRVRMADGSAQPIQNVRIGDALAGGAAVTSVLQFNGTAGCAAMVSVDGVHVSGNHYVRAPAGHWIRADKHPTAIAVPLRPRIWCLCTTTNAIPIIGSSGDLLFTDYEESSDPTVVAAAQALSERTLNVRCRIPVGPTVPDYSLGLDPETLVRMNDGAWLPLKDVQLGARVFGGIQVIGLVSEVCGSVCAKQGMSAAQLVLNEGWRGSDEQEVGRWIRAGAVWPTTTTTTATTIMQQLILEKSYPLHIQTPYGVCYTVRDYTEIGTASEAPYVEWLTGVGSKLEGY